jgi:excinuclease ABC subunit A
LPDRQATQNTVGQGKPTAVNGRLVDQGNTVVTIEHNLDIIKEADWIIDVRPEGDAGGEVVAMGPPDRVIDAERSHTACYLRDFLNGGETRLASSRA